MSIKSALNIIKIMLQYFFPIKSFDLQYIINDMQYYIDIYYEFQMEFSYKKIKLLEKQIKKLNDNRNLTLKNAKTYIMIIINFIEYLMKDSLFEFKLSYPIFLSEKHKTEGFLSNYKYFEKLFENHFIIYIYA